MSGFGATLLGGAMLADPSLVGTEEALFLISSADAKTAEMEAAKPTLEALGSV